MRTTSSRIILGHELPHPPAGLRDGQDEVERAKQNLTGHFAMRRFIGTAPSFVAAVDKLPRVAACDATVLLTGETGTGKEMCARVIHNLSPRAGKAFVPINCGSLPADLFENELFGHESGAFTDARHASGGIIAEAEGGTLLLDEVDTLSPMAQVKLLRFLQDRRYRPLGGSRDRPANTRVLAASNSDLHQRVRDHAFREDLYYRLKVISLWLPPLRERQEDIMPLALDFLTTAIEEYGSADLRFSEAAVAALRKYAWPGNVRQFENVIRQAVVLASGPMILVSDLDLSPVELLPDAPAPVCSGNGPFKIAKARAIACFERNYLTESLLACHGNISEAAREAKKDRRSFFALLKKYQLLPARRAALDQEGHESC